MKDAEALHATLRDRGFDPGPVVRLQRPAETEQGPATARFSVVRMAPDVAREGRVQVCAHHTPDVVWQLRFVVHPNGAGALSGILICVDDPAESAGRFGRFLGCPSSERNGAIDLQSARGRTTFIKPGALGSFVAGLVAPTQPFMAAIGVAVHDLRATATFLKQAGVSASDLGGGRLLVGRDDALGAAIVFHTDGVKPWA
ncbi:MAG: VOC family protein [Rhodospirillales bacterium]|nr:VOC family protein [Rhodospirillales bacterium]